LKQNDVQHNDKFKCKEKTCTINKTKQNDTRQIKRELNTKDTWCARNQDATRNEAMAHQKNKLQQNF
jgi:hypothetical protein